MESVYSYHRKREKEKLPLSGVSFARQIRIP